MKCERLLVSGTMLGIAAGCFLLWSLVVTHDLPVGPTARQAVNPQTSLDAHITERHGASARENGARETLANASAQELMQSRPGLEVLIRHADSVEGETAQRDNAARVAETIDEAWHQLVADPNAALAWALDQDRDMARVALRVVLTEWAQDDPAAAFEAMTQSANVSADTHLRAYGLALVVESWAVVDPGAALDAVDILPSSLGTNLLRSRILAAWAQDDPVEASTALQALVNQAADAGAAPRGLESTVASLGYRLAHHYGAQAADWALEFPPGTDARNNALAGVVSAWMDDNPQAVGDWLDGMDPGPGRDAGVLSLVQAYATEAPKTALAWAATISDEAQRLSLVSITAARWLSAAPEEAEAWIRTATLVSDEQREEIFEARAKIPRPGRISNSP